MNQHETTWLRKIIFLVITMLAIVSSVASASVRPVFTQTAPADFGAVDDYMNTKMEELGIPRAALVVKQKHA